MHNMTNLQKINAVKAAVPIIKKKTIIKETFKTMVIEEVRV